MTDETHAIEGKLSEQEIGRIAANAEHWGEATTDPAFAEYAVLRDAAAAIRQLIAERDEAVFERDSWKRAAQVLADTVKNRCDRIDQLRDHVSENRAVIEAWENRERAQQEEHGR
jgi:hypothetical protein